ncbi:NAD(P)-binding protein, partial [Tricholoma matsutake]
SCFSASGFIGFPVAQALIRAGHHVIGVTRSETKAKQLATEEIVPIVGDVATSDAWIHFIKDIDVIIDAVGGLANLPVLSQLILLAISKAAQATCPLHVPKVTYIYTSGTWVHGENRNDIVSDTTPITSPADIVAWRPAQEQRIIEEMTLNGLVICPSLLYGRGASLLAPLFKSASEGHVMWPSTLGGRFALIHPDDLTNLYVHATEKSSIVGGKIFDASNDFTESVDNFLAVLIKVSGAQGPYEYIKPSNAYEVALAMTSLV